MNYLSRFVSSERGHADGQKGFTLIELLVVIAIIGLLSSVVLASLNSARAKARDARRVSDLKQIANMIATLPENQAFAGCTGADAEASTCTTPALSVYNDPSATAGVDCTSASTAVCDYTISQDDGGAGATANDWQVCAYLETGAGDLSSGVVTISSGSSYSIISGAANCN